MKNITGAPVEGDDFFDRPQILSKLRRDLDNLANILLVAPRRVGKTSLVLRLCERWRSEQKRNAVFVNVEGRSDELAFAEKLIDELRKAGLNPAFFTRALGVFTKIRQGLGGKGLKVAGFEVSLGEAADVDHSTLGKVLESVFRKIEDGDNQVLIAIDELPEFLLTLQKEEDGPKRVTAFLHWLRELRQTYRRNIRWIFLGSIGLDNFVEAQKIQKLINDLHVSVLDAFSEDEADAFLKILGASNSFELTEVERKEIIRQLGWPLAYYLQLIFHELRDLETRSISEAFKSLLQPQKLLNFDTWHQRIHDQFSQQDAAICLTILDHLCVHPDGREREHILDRLMAKKPSADVDQVKEQLSSLLLVLQRDGYLLENAGRYTFRSFLLREYWRRRRGQ
jgi:uncharacterized protein